MFLIVEVGVEKILSQIGFWLSPSIGDFPFDLLTAVAKFLRRLLDNALEVDFESAWLIWDLIEIAIFVAATLLLVGLLRHLFRQHSDREVEAVASDAPAKARSALDAAFETVERLKQNFSSASVRTSPTNQEIRDAAKVLLSTTVNAVDRYPVVAVTAHSDRLVISQSLVDQLVSLAAENPGFGERLEANGGCGK